MLNKSRQNGHQHFAIKEKKKATLRVNRKNNDMFYCTNVSRERTNEQNLYANTQVKDNQESSRTIPIYSKRDLNGVKFYLSKHAPWPRKGCIRRRCRCTAPPRQSRAGTERKATQGMERFHQHGRQVCTSTHSWAGLAPHMTDVIAEWCFDCYFFTCSIVTDTVHMLLLTNPCFLKRDLYSK